MAEWYAKEDNPRAHFDEHVVPRLKKYDIANPDTDNPEDLGKAAETLYACQDYEQVSGLYRGDWSYIWIQVKMFLDGEEIAWDSLGGIEHGSYTEEWTRDKEDLYISETVNGLIYECKAQVPAYIKRVKGVLEKLESPA